MVTVKFLKKVLEKVRVKVTYMAVMFLMSLSLVSCGMCVMFTELAQCSLVLVTHVHGAQGSLLGLDADPGPGPDPSPVARVVPSIQNDSNKCIRFLGKHAYA